MDLNICFNCMNVSDAGATFCNHCGTQLGQMPESDNEALKIGTVLHGRYIVGKKLGQGGFGITYMGYDLVLSCRVAIKEYYPKNEACRESNHSSMLIWKTENAYQTGCKNILREAQKIAKVNNIPNVVRVQDTFEENHTAYIIMNYIEGITLKDKIKKEGTLSFEKCTELLKPVIIGLNSLHNNGIIHRDISPDNIMISNENEPFLLDMGAAKDIASGVSEPIGVAKHGYSPVEQYNSDTPIGPWVDVYALSATIFYCISGTSLLNSVSRAADRHIDFSSVKEKLSKKEKDLLVKGLEPDYTKRLQNVTAFIDCKPRKKNNKAIKIAGIAAILVVVIGLLSVGLSRLFTEKVEYMGNTAANLYNFGNHVMDPANMNFFFTDAEQNFYFNKIEKGTFIDFDESEQITDNATFLNISESGTVYYMTYNSESEQYELCSYYPKKKKVEVLFSSDTAIGFVFYVRTNKNNEYLYFLKEEEESSASTDDFVFSFYRYDIKKDDTRLILDKTDISIFLIHEDKLYISENVSALESVSYTTNLKGKNKKLLKENSDAVILGLTSDKLIMAKEDGALRVFLADHSGKELINTVFSKNIEISDSEKINLTEAFLKDDFRYVYDERYLYFFNDGVVRQASFNGNEVKTLFSEVKAVDNMNIVNSNLFMQIETNSGYVSNFFVPVYPDYENENFDCSNLIFIDAIGLSYYIIQKDELKYEVVDDSYIKITDYNPIEGRPTSFVTLPADIDAYPVKEIGSSVFENSVIEYFHCPSSLEVIGDSAFRDSSLKSIELNENLLEIGEECFSGTNITEITLPSSVNSVSGFAFQEAESLRRIYVSDKNSKFTDENGILFSKNKKTIVAFPMNYGISSYSVPDSVITIGEAAFYKSTLKNVTLPDTLERINESAFFLADIDSLKLPENITGIEGWALDGITYEADLTVVDWLFSDVEQGDSEIIDITFTPTGERVNITCYYDSSVCSTEWLDNNANNEFTLKVTITAELKKTLRIPVILLDDDNNLLGCETLVFM